MAQILDGKALAQKVRERIAAETKELRAEHGIIPGLAVILVGADPASEVYVKNKEKAAAEVGFHSVAYRLPPTTPQAELEELIDRLNADSAIHGILVQHPLPEHMDERAAFSRIAPAKDVDGFHAVSAGRLLLGEPGFVPCTPRGVMELLAEYQIPLSGKKAVVIGRSNIVGKPMAMLLLRENATVTVVHSKTPDLAAETRTADVLVAAVGRSRMITADHVKEGAVVIDVGVNRTPEGLAGDVDFAAVEPKAAYITPVPGGVGPLTIAMLLKNTLDGAAGRIS